MFKSLPVLLGLPSAAMMLHFVVAAPDRNEWLPLRQKESVNLALHSLPKSNYYNSPPRQCYS